MKVTKYLFLTLVYMNFKSHKSVCINYRGSLILLTLLEEVLVCFTSTHVSHLYLELKLKLSMWSKLINLRKDLKFT